jgi:modulator of FtsH protease HflK
MIAAPEKSPVDRDESPRPLPDGPPPVAPPGPIVQSVALGFRALYVAGVLLTLFWLTSGVREIASDSQVVVRQFGRIVRAQQTGLLMAWPRPIQQVQFLPGPQRQLTQDVSALVAPSEKYQALVGGVSPSTKNSRTAAPQYAGAYLTGDGNVVLLTASLIYRINDPIAYALEEDHVGPALDRLFRANAVRITAGKNLNDIVVQTSAGQSNNGQSLSNGQKLSEVRELLVRAMNDRLRGLQASGAGLGVEVEQINLTPSLTPGAKAAFDQVLVATQAADRGVAVALTDAEHKRQQAINQAEQLVSAADATAKETVSKAEVDTASILALVNGERTFESGDSLLLREYRARVANIMSTGRVTLVDPKSGTRVLLQGKQP